MPSSGSENKIEAIMLQQDEMLKSIKLEYKRYIDDPMCVYGMCQNNDSLKEFDNCEKRWLVIMKKLSSTMTNEARRVTDSKYALFRADELKVLVIIDTDNCQTTDSIIYICGKSSTRYKIDSVVKTNRFDIDLENVTGNGILFFKTIEPAYFFCPSSDRFTVSGDQAHMLFRYSPPSHVLTSKNKSYTGTWVSFYDNGQVGSVKHYVNGLMTSFHTIWDFDGNKKCDIEYKNGKKSGTSKSWHDNGTIQLIMHYVDGKEHGESTLYYEDGTKRSKGKYINSYKDGVWLSWHNNGKLHTRQIYVDKFENGMREEWDKNGKKIYEKFYKGGIPEP